MVSKKSDEFHLKKILDNCQLIVSIMASIDSIDEFSIDLKSQNAVMFSSIQIAENTKRLSEVFKRNNPEVQWQGLIGFRNIVIHDYENIDLNRVYDIVKNNVPELYQQLLKIKERN